MHKKYLYLPVFSPTLHFPIKILTFIRHQVTLPELNLLYLTKNFPVLSF